MTTRTPTPTVIRIQSTLCPFMVNATFADVRAAIETHLRAWERVYMRDGVLSAYGYEETVTIRLRIDALAIPMELDGEFEIDLRRRHLIRWQAHINTVELCRTEGVVELGCDLEATSEVNW